MSQDNVNADTQEQEIVSLEEAVFGDDGSAQVESAFTEAPQKTEEAAPQGQPAETVAEEQPVSNDVKRYQYWQSQADKLKAENEQLKAASSNTPAPAPVPQHEEPAQEEFPPPPEKPQRARTFNREEAYSDPSSDSARYMDELEDWRDNINEYNTLKTQYQGAVMEEKLHNMQQERVAEAKRQQYANQRAQQANNVKEHVMGNYGMNESEAQDFMSKMSDPNSLNIDNLVQLYRMQNGGAPAQQQAPAQPSQTFTQTQNAQQVPSPMGVMPSGANNTDTRSLEDKIMDKMIGSFEDKNPWK